MDPESARLIADTIKYMGGDLGGWIFFGMILHARITS